MSRLDSVIRRLSAQRDCLNAAIDLVPEGDFLEIGLGNGRTYDHLRDIAPGRAIWVIDRKVKAHPKCIPPAEYLLEGEADDTLRRLANTHSGKIAMAHYDLGIGVPEEDTPQRERLAPLIAALLHPQGVLVTNGSMPGLKALDLPLNVPEGRYWMLVKP